MIANNSIQQHTVCLSLLSSVSVCFLFVLVSLVGLSVWMGWRWLLLVSGRVLLVLGFAACACACVLSCPVLSCPVLSCPVLSCPVLCCPVLSCAVLSCPVLSCAVLCCAVPVLCCPVLSCAVLCCAVLCCVVLCCVVLWSLLCCRLCCRLCLFVITAVWKKAGLVAYVVGLCANGNG